MPVRRTDTVHSGARTDALSFLFSDIEGSSRRWEVHREAMEEALLLHDALLRNAHLRGVHPQARGRAHTRESSFILAAHRARDNRDYVALPETMRVTDQQPSR